MFTGMVKLKWLGQSTTNGDCVHLPPLADMSKGDPAVALVGQGPRRTHLRRPGYMRPELLNEPGITMEGEGKRPCLTNGGPLGRGLESTPLLPGASRPNVPLAANGIQRGHMASPGQDRSGFDLQAGGIFSFPDGVKDTPESPANDCFNSSFSFIRLSLSSTPGIDTAVAKPSTGSLGQSECRPVLPGQSELGPVLLGQSGLGLVPASFLDSLPVSPEMNRAPARFFNGEPWRVVAVAPWENSAVAPSELKEGATDYNTSFLDAEAASSLSVDSSDAASGSSITSGYESTTPCPSNARDTLLKKYEGVLQECLQSNRTNAKIESMMLKLQRLQQKAVLEDDYDSAERFGKKLEELRRERGTLKLGLPSRHPAVSGYLGRLRAGVQSALQRAGGHCGERTQPQWGEESPALLQGREGVFRPLLRRERLLQEKQLVEAEIQELQHRLEELRERGRRLEQDIRQEEEEEQLEGEESSSLRSCTPAQLRELGRALEEVAASKHRAQICSHPPLSVLRLQEREQALNTSIREATAKVVMSQRLAGSLRRKVSDCETQLLGLHEAKMAAVSGSDFASAKELKAEMRCLYGERDRLEGLVKKLQALSDGNSLELARRKEEHARTKQELEQREAQFENRLKDDVMKYTELLEDKLHSCGHPAVERVWEADLEVCHLVLRGLQLRKPSDCEAVPLAPGPHPEDPSCAPPEADCAMLTALGGRWCSEADLQHSEFAKKLEEFLFCMEDNQPEVLCPDAASITEQCESISDRLLSLEDQLQTAVRNRDKALSQSLQKEVKEVKASLQAMLRQLTEEEEEEKEVVVAEDGEEVAKEEEDEEQYFSDSWEI